MPINMILHASKLVKDNRTIMGVGLSTCAEAGELADECRIVAGESYKTPGPDGVVGEAADVVNSAIDATFVNDPDITADDLYEQIRVKLLKWLAKTGTFIDTDDLYFGLKPSDFEEFRAGFDKLGYTLSYDEDDDNNRCYCIEQSNGWGPDMLVYSLAEVQVAFNTITCFGK